MLKYSFNILLIMLLMPTSLWAFDANSAFKTGNSFYEKENYSEAKDQYLSCIENKYFSKEIYLNLGNVYFKLDSIPQAILYYEKGLKLAPDNENLQYNLNHVNSLINIQPEKTKSVQLNDVVYGYLNKDSDFWAYASILLISLTSILLALYLIANNLTFKKIGFYSAICTFIISLMMVYFAMVSKSKMKQTDYAIVFSPYVELKTKPSVNSTTAFELRDGNKLKIIDENDNWYKISYNGEIAFIEKKYLKRF